jgi:hypothetical protein
MRAKLALIVLPLAGTWFAGSACAVNSPTRQPIDCRVVNGGKLPAESGGTEALCAAIARAAAEQPSAGRFSVEVRVLGTARLAATVTTADGKRLPEQRFAVSDRDLTKSSFERFARALAEEAAKAGGQ